MQYRGFLTKTPRFSANGYNNFMFEYKKDSDVRIMTRDQVRGFDAFAINTLGIAGVVLMENAARSCAEMIIEKLDVRSQKSEAENANPSFRAPTVREAGNYNITSGKSGNKPLVLIFCGTGNNGGDGFVIARHLSNNNIGVRVIVCGSRDKIKGDALANLTILENIGQEITYIDLEKIAQASPLVNKISTETAQECCHCEAISLSELIGDADFIVDALLGTGLAGQVKDSCKKIIESINSAGCPVLAVDIPSGLDCDTGRPLGAAVQADYTVTFVAVKKGFTNPESAKYTGRVFVASIGVGPK